MPTSRRTPLPPRAADATLLPHHGPTPALAAVHRAIVSCERCPRLRRYCQRIAVEKRAAFRDEVYWGRPVPGFGDPARATARSSAWRRPRTAPTARDACSPAMASADRAISCWRRCTPAALPTSPSRGTSPTGSSCATRSSPPPSAARRRTTSRRPKSSAAARATCSPSGTRCPTSPPCSASASWRGTPAGARWPCAAIRCRARARSSSTARACGSTTGSPSSAPTTPAARTRTPDV